MRNNLQADNLSKLYSFKFSRFIESEVIELDKKAFKNIKEGSWLNIETTALKAEFIDKKEIIANVELIPNGEYLYAEFKSKKRVKKYISKSTKKSFALRIKVDTIWKNRVLVLEKMPILAMMLRDNKEFAYVNLFFNGSFVLEVKELL